jgi:phage tail sheath protein FI
MATYKTPNVYVEEISLLPPSVAEVETAIPAFIGHTERARKNKDGDLLKVPTRISSMQEFKRLFGGPFPDPINVTVNQDAQGNLTGTVDETDPKYLLYYSMEVFYANGGGPCYIISVGDYNADVSETTLTAGLPELRKEDEPTLIVIPEAVKISSQDKYAPVVQAVLKQCGELGDRFAIIDVRRGDEWLDPAGWNGTRTQYGTSYLKYGAAYYPFLKTALSFYLKPDDKEALGDNVKVKLTKPAPTNANPNATETKDKKLTELKEETAVYNYVLARLDSHYVVLPPSGAVAGVYARTDRDRGVWKAPANVSLNHVIAPVVKIDDAMQGDLNVDTTGGKSINAIRGFMGKGNLVWGARTLAGNDNEWRYVPVRRLFNMVEESVKKSTYWAVFESNDANTWAKVRGMIENYLVQKWREGALAGATPKDAFFVRCGLGTTMDAQDILEGRMNVEIGMAAVRPAEFIILKFSHKLQTS